MKWDNKEKLALSLSLYFFFWRHLECKDEHGGMSQQKMGTHTNESSTNSSVNPKSMGTKQSDKQRNGWSGDIGEKAEKMYREKMYTGWEGRGGSKLTGLSEATEE